MRKKILKIAIIALLIVSIMMTNFLVLATNLVSYAFSEAGQQNVEFVSYFELEDGSRSNEIEKSISADDINLCMEVEVKQEGYLNGQIELKNNNFKFKQQENENIAHMTDNAINLKQINAGQKVKIQVGLEVNLGETIELASFNQENTVTLTGTYQNAMQKEAKIEKETAIKVALTNVNSMYLDTQIITNKIYEMNGENKRIVQVAINSGLEEVGYPIKQTNLQLEAPEMPEKIEVLDRGTQATKENSMQYQAKDNQLAIQITNPEKEGKVNYGREKTDNLIVTYVYPEEKIIQEQEIKIKSEIQLYDTQETNLTKEVTNKIQEEVEAIIDYQVKNQTELYKGKIYAGVEQNYISSSTIDIRYPQIEKNIEITEGNAYYQKEVDGVESTETANTFYTKTMINQEELLKVMGEQGELIIQKTDGTEIKKINQETMQNEENILIIEYPEEQREINIKINNAQNTGIITMTHEKVIQSERRQRNDVKVLTKLTEEGNLQETQQIQAKQGKDSISLKEPQAKAEAEMNQTQLVAGKTNKNVEIKTILTTNESKYDLYKNPTIEFEFPQEVQEVRIKSVNLLYGEELTTQKQEVYVNEAGNQVIRIELAGEQTRYTETELIKGANIILNCDITVAPLEENSSNHITFRYTNEQEVQYDEESTKEIEIKYAVMQETGVVYQNRLTTEPNEIEEINQPIIVTKSISAGDDEDIYEGQIQKYTITVKNNTNQPINNVIVKDEIPNELIYADYISRQTYTNYYKEDESIKEFAPEKIETLEAQEEIKLCYYARVKKQGESQGKKIGTKAQVTIEGQEESYESNLVENTIQESKLQIDMVTAASNTERYMKGDNIPYKVVVKNISEETLTDIIVNTRIPEGTIYVEGGNLVYDEEEHYYHTEKKENLYNSNTNMVTWNVNSLKPGEETVIYDIVQLDEIQDEITIIPTQAMAKAKETETYYSNIEEVQQTATARCSIIKQTNLASPYIKEGDEFEYIVTVTNTGNREYVNAFLTDELPEGVVLKEINCTKGEETEKIISNEVDIYCPLKPGESMTARILVEADDLPKGMDKLEIKNKAVFKESEMGEVASNEVSNIITENPDIPNYEPGDDPNGDSNGDNNGNNSGYTISGVAWLDENKNGRKDSGENTLQGIPVLLYDENGKQVNDKISSITGTDGSYTLSNLPRGNYMVVFQYDNKNYALTDYKKVGTTDEENSKVTMMKLNGETVAITDTISVTNSNIENINIGLIQGTKFDLRLDKSITKITVQSGKGTKQYSYNHANFAKVEVDRKTINNTTVTIEYAIKVTNEGEIEGYASKIVDYLPSDLQFNAQQNKDWKVENGQLVSTSLSNDLIRPGETRTLYLQATKKITEDNLGTVTNTAEITQDGNVRAMKDIDNEDRRSTVSVIIGINTGRIIMYTSLIIITVIVLALGIYEIRKKVLIK